MVTCGTKSSIQFMESIPNKWYYHQTARPSPSKSNNTCTESLLDIKYTMAYRDMETTDLSRALAASSGTRFSSQTIHRHVARPFTTSVLWTYRTRKPVYRVAEHTKNRSVFCFHWWAIFSTQSYSRRIYICREPGARFHPSNVREIDHFGAEECLSEATSRWAVVHHCTSLMRLVSTHGAITMMS